MSETEVVTWCHAKIRELDPHPKPLWAKVEIREMNEPIMIHVEDGRKIIGGPKGPQISNTPEHNFPTPRIGDEIVFIPDVVSRTMQTTRWGFKADYDKAVHASTPAKYRCIVSYRYAGARFFEPDRIAWEGTLASIEAFAEKSAMEYYDLENHDHMLNHMTYTYVVRWESSPDGGKTWRACKCPDEYTQRAGSARDM